MNGSRWMDISDFLLFLLFSSPAKKHPSANLNYTSHTHTLKQVKKGEKMSVILRIGHKLCLLKLWHDLKGRTKKKFSSPPELVTEVPMCELFSLTLAEKHEKILYNENK